MTHRVSVTVALAGRQDSWQAAYPRGTSPGDAVGAASRVTATAGLEYLFLRGRRRPIRRFGCGGDLVQPADRAEQVRLTVPALLMLPGEVRGTARENQLQPAANRESEPQHPPDHYGSPAICPRRAATRCTTAHPLRALSHRQAWPSLISPVGTF